MFCQWKRRWFYIYFIWWPFWTPSLTLVSWMNTQRSYLAFQRRHTQTQQQIPESPTVTLTWHASKYKALTPPEVHPHTCFISSVQSYVLCCCCCCCCCCSYFMCVLLHLLICTALRAHIIVVEALYKIIILTSPKCLTSWKEHLEVLSFAYKSRKKYRRINCNHFCNRLFYLCGVYLFEDALNRSKFF